MATPDVTICIPAFEAEPFIKRTLECASAQTHEDVRILVSVDCSTDATVDVCREFAQSDPRVEVIAQHSRLGWSDNANALLELVDTPYYFFYFHDDEIDADYAATLRAALESSPDAASAHCDIERFGLTTGIQIGEEFDGDATSRILTYLAHPHQGLLLRAMLRREFVGHLRFPNLPGGGKSRALPFTLGLLAGGSSRHVPGARYHRWIRAGGLTRNWNAHARDDLVARERAAAVESLRVIDSVAGEDPEARAVMTAALGSAILRDAAREARALGVQEIAGDEVGPAFAGLTAPTASGRSSKRLAQRLRQVLQR